MANELICEEKDKVLETVVPVKKRRNNFLKHFSVYSAGTVGHRN